MISTEEATSDKGDDVQQVSVLGAGSRDSPELVVDMEELLSEETMSEWLKLFEAQDLLSGKKMSEWVELSKGLSHHHNASL